MYLFKCAFFVKPTCSSLETASTNGDKISSIPYLSMYAVLTTVTSWIELVDDLFNGYYKFRISLPVNLLLTGFCSIKVSYIQMIQLVKTSPLVALHLTFKAQLIRYTLFNEDCYYLQMGVT